MTITERPLFGRVELQRLGTPNILPGADFEDPAAVPFPMGGAFAIQTDPALAYQGSRRLRITAGTGTRTAVSKPVRVEPGARYRIELWARRDDAYNGTINNSKLRVAVPAGGSMVTSLSYALSDLTTAATWTRRAIEFVAPAGGFVTFAPVADHTAGLVYVDAIEVRRVSPGWDPIATADALSITARRGGSRTALGIRTDVGIMTFDVLDAEDPMRGGTFQPGQSVRAVSRDRAGGMAELFTGRVVDVAAAYPMNKSTGRQRTVTRVTVADAVKVHGETPRYGVQLAGGFETFEARVQRLAGSALAAVEPPAEGAPREVYAL